MKLQRSLCDKFRKILLEGTGRYLELVGRPKDMRGGELRIFSHGAPHSRGCSYMNLLRAGGGKGAWGRGARRKVCCKDICPPLRHEAVNA
jgi:hypothetical protein